MFRFPLQYLLFSLAMFTFSCKGFQLEHAISTVSDKRKVENLYFSKQDTDYLYKGLVEVYGNKISGIFILKKISENSHRVAMTTDFGNKILDFEISENEFKINYIVPDMDKNMVKKILENDFRILLKQSFPLKEFFKNAEENIFTSENRTEKYYLFFDNESGLLKKLIQTENNKEKINFNFEAKTPIFADEISLIHKNIKLSIHLQRLTNN